MHTIAGSPWQVQEVQREEWHIQHSLQGKLFVDLDPLLDSAGTVTEGVFSPGMSLSRIWGLHTCRDAEGSYLGEELLRLRVIAAADPEFTLRLNETGRFELFYGSPQFVVDAQSCSHDDCQVSIPQKLPGDAVEQPLPPVADICLNSLQNIARGSRSEFPLELIDERVGVIWLINGAIEPFDGQPYIGGTGTVTRRKAILHRSPHLASLMEAEVSFGDPYTMVDIWMDRHGQTWLLLDMGDQRRGWYIKQAQPFSQVSPSLAAIVFAIQTYLDEVDE